MDRKVQERETEAAEADPRRDARTRARAYLDLWERHVVHTALHGPVPVWLPVPA